MAKRLNSKQKGNRGERELAEVLRMAGFEAHRAQQYCGRAGTEDISHNIPGLYIECKRVERLNLPDAYRQATRDAPTHKAPAVIHKANHSPWMISLSLEHFLDILRAPNGLDL
jgi:hypothetical protein